MICWNDVSGQVAGLLETTPPSMRGAFGTAPSRPAPRAKRGALPNGGAKQLCARSSPETHSLERFYAGRAKKGSFPRSAWGSSLRLPTLPSGDPRPDPDIPLGCRRERPVRK
jgi:hypothetical protein